MLLAAAAKTPPKTGIRAKTLENVSQAIKNLEVQFKKMKIHQETIDSQLQKLINLRKHGGGFNSKFKQFFGIEKKKLQKFARDFRGKLKSDEYRRMDRIKNEMIEGRKILAGKKGGVSPTALRMMNQEAGKLGDFTKRLKKTGDKYRKILGAESHRLKTMIDSKGKKVEKWKRKEVDALEKPLLKNSDVKDIERIE
jgi:hypothetical protein